MWLSKILTARKYYSQALIPECLFRADDPNQCYNSVLLYTSQVLKSADQVSFKSSR